MVSRGSQWGLLDLVSSHLAPNRLFANVILILMSVMDPLKGQIQSLLISPVMLLQGFGLTLLCRLIILVVQLVPIILREILKKYLVLT